MPPTMEIKCNNDDCVVDMFELHFTYDVRDDPTASEFSCPECGTATELEEIVL